jgi:Xaa-Pro dipeptidase
MKHLGIKEKALEAINNSEFDAVVISGTDHVQFLGGIFLPFSNARRGQKVIIFWPKEDDPVLICPAEWESTIRHSTWFNQILPYNASSDRMDGIVPILKGEINNLMVKVPNIGIDKEKISHELFSILQAAIKPVEWNPCDDWINQLRMIKTQQELEHLKKLALDTDHGINGAIHHVTIDRYQTALTLAEEIRVHTTERELDLVGYHAASHVAAGKDIQRIWPMPPVFGYSRTRAFKEGDLVRMRMQACRDGYWSDATRIMTAGEPTSGQNEIFQQWMTVRGWIIDKLRPGVAINEVYKNVLKNSIEAGIPLLAEIPFGHGVGMMPEEPPFITASDETIILPNMILIVCPIIKAPDKTYFWMKDTIVITDRGNVLAGWYKDWREPYIPIASI